MREGARALEGVAGFVEAPRFYPYLTAARTSSCSPRSTATAPRERIDEVLEIVELAPRAKHTVGGYSHGMRQRLGIAAALLRRPRLLILDEPATGLDPAGMRDMRLLIRRLADEGITVLLSSHQLPEVQELCDRVAIVDSRARRLRGRARRPAPPGRRRLPAAHDRRRARAARSRARSRASSTRRARRARARLPGRGARRRRAVARARRAPASAILALTPELATLEDLFFRLTEGAGATARRRRRRRGAGARPRAEPLGGGRDEQRRRRTPAAAVAAPRPPRAAPVDAHRLPLGAAQARLAEAHLPRPRRSASLLPLIFVVVQNLHAATTATAGQHLRRADHPVGARDAGADAARSCRSSCCR